MNKWRTIDSAPDDGNVLVFGGRHSKVELVAADGSYWRMNKGNVKAIPTHWMPLPKPPYCLEDANVQIDFEDASYEDHLP